MRVVDLVEKIRNREGDPSEHLSELVDYFSQMADTGKSICLEKVPEKEMCVILEAIKAALLTALIAEEKGELLLLADTKGNDLTAFCDTFGMTLIGLLYDNEVI